MSWERHGNNFSKFMTSVVRGGHSRKIVITDKNNRAVISFPFLLFVVFILFLPIVAGIALYFFLLSEYHAIVEKNTEQK